MASANQFIGFAIDPTTLGSTKDSLGVTPAYAPITLWLPVITAQVNPGYSNLDRNNEVIPIRGQREATAFRALPTVTFTCRLYPTMAAFFLPKLLGGAITSTGTAPAAITSKVGVATTALPATQCMVVRGTQTDRVTGLWGATATLNVPPDGDVTLEVTMRGLWHKHFTTSAPPSPTLLDESPYSTVTLVSKLGASSTVIDCVSQMSLSFDNKLVDDVDVIYCKGQNIETTLLPSGKYARRQWPGRHKLGNQSVSGSLGFGTERVDMEDRARVAQADKLVFELTADPITPATTPAADQLLRLTVPRFQVSPDGGGASALDPDKDPSSTYQFGGFIDPSTNQTLFAEFVGAAALT